MAAMSSNSGDDELIVGINVTPLVDVVLVLLIIFMLTAPVLYQSAIKVNLPKAVSGDKTEHITLKFTLAKDGRIMLGKDVITKENVPAIIAQALKQDSTANAVLSADESLSHGTVVSFLDILKSNGIERFAIGVEGKSNDKKGN